MPKSHINYPDISDESDFNIWNICSEISNKENWYIKVFDECIVGKWRDEVLQHNKEKKDIILTNDEFDYALALMRASAVGTKHNDDCEWEDGHNICNDCRENIKTAIIKKYENDGYDVDDKTVEECISKWISEADELEDICKHPLCKCIPANCELHQYIVYRPEGIVSQELHQECKKQIHNMMDQEPVDWHPGSKNQVRDLIHPSMYCYVAGKSMGINGQVIEPAHEDESKQYQWLPTKFSVSEDGKSVLAQSYINNFDHCKYRDFGPIIERVLATFVPDLEKVMGKTICGKDLQVIVKVGNVILNAGEYPGGSWHIEGMPQEHIAATCLHYVDMDNITDSFLEFRKPVIVSEDLDYPQNDGRYTTHHYGIEPDSHYEGHQNRYLGLIKCTEGSSVVFPNTLQHRVKEFKPIDRSKPSLRTIIAFFIIDPNRPIIDTTAVPKQQGVFTEEEAKHYRERLMYHRKYFVNKLNKEVFQRSFSLCEH